MSSSAVTRRRWFDRMTEHFGPQWFGSTMGLGALGIALSLVGARLGVAAASTAGRLVVGFTAVLTAVYAVPWLRRFVRYPDRVRADLSHPIRGQFFPTMPITLLVLGVGFESTFGGLVPASVLTAVVTALFVAGTVGVVVFGLVVVVTMFANEGVEAEHAVFAWYIPPVSHLVIPIPGLLLIESVYAGTPTARLLFVVSVGALGVGTFTFLLFGAVVLYRYMYEALPPAKLAPTFVIGLAPTSVLVVDVTRLLGALDGGVGLGIGAAALAPGLKLLALLLWSFSAWWFVLTVALVGYYLRRHGHPFHFTWWAYTFPVGAFAISTGALESVYPLSGLAYVLVGVTGVLAVACGLALALTGRMVVRGRAFVAE